MTQISTDSENLKLNSSLWLYKTTNVAAEFRTILLYQLQVIILFNSNLVMRQIDYYRKDLICLSIQSESRDLTVEVDLHIRVVQRWCRTRLQIAISFHIEWISMQINNRWKEKSYQNLSNVMPNLIRSQNIWLFELSLYMHSETQSLQVTESCINSFVGKDYVLKLLIWHILVINLLAGKD